MRSAARALGLVALFAICTAIVTWPQARVLGTQAVPHQDVYFNMWRLETFAHQVVHAPARLFDGNIFFPEPRTLAYSDATPVEGTIAAPLIWSGVRPLLVHNLMLFGAMVLSGAAMFALAHHLTGSRGAGVVAGLIFALAPYRFEHVMHMELQWVMWAPLALLALHRAIETGRWRWGLATGAFLALQMLSSVYYGVYLATLLGVMAVLDLRTDVSVRRFRRSKCWLALRCWLGRFPRCTPCPTCERAMSPAGDRCRTCCSSAPVHPVTRWRRRTTGCTAA